MSELWFRWRETSVRIDVCFEAKKKLPCQTTYVAAGVQSCKDYWNANVNDSGILTLSESVSGYWDTKRHNKFGSQIKLNNAGKFDIISHSGPIHLKYALD